MTSIYRTRHLCDSVLRAALLMTVVVCVAGCGDKKADEATPTAVSSGKPGSAATPDQPARGEAGNAGSGNQVQSPPAPPP